MISRLLFVGRDRLGDSPVAALAGERAVDFTDTSPTEKDLEAKELVIEMFPEGEDKREVLSAMTRCTTWQGTVASRIERQSATYWALETGLAGRFVGFVLPPGAGKTPAVELLKGEMTSSEAVEYAAGVFKGLGCHVTVLRDQVGGILLRVLAGMINEAAFLAQSNIAPVDQIDRMMKLAANFPLGPFEWADQIGLDRLLSLLETLTAEFGSIYRPCPLIRRKVEAGRLGRKTGEGFYVYTEKGDT